MQQLLGRPGSRLELDQLVMAMVHKILGTVTEYEPDGKISAQLKKNHLITIERAKEYIARNFARDISLMEIAAYCYVSPFHFSRIFKTFTSYSPHKYLAAIRLQHAAQLLRSTALPVADIGFSSGFNSVEHFTAAFHQRYKCPPSRLRAGGESVK
jgi:AraC-like DNA-binding protein